MIFLQTYADNLDNISEMYFIYKPDSLRERKKSISYVTLFLGDTLPNNNWFQGFEDSEEGKYFLTWSQEWENWVCFAKQDEFIDK